MSHARKTHLSETGLVALSLLFALAAGAMVYLLV